MKIKLSSYLLFQLGHLISDKDFKKEALSVQENIPDYSYD